MNTNASQTKMTPSNTSSARGCDTLTQCFTIRPKVPLVLTVHLRSCQVLTQRKLEAQAIFSMAAVGLLVALVFFNQRKG